MVLHHLFICFTTFYLNFINESYFSCFLLSPFVFVVFSPSLDNSLFSTQWWLLADTRCSHRLCNSREASATTSNSREKGHLELRPPLPTTTRTCTTEDAPSPPSPLLITYLLLSHSSSLFITITDRIVFMLPQPNCKETVTSSHSIRPAGKIIF